MGKLSRVAQPDRRAWKCPSGHVVSAVPLLILSLRTGAEIKWVALHSPGSANK